MARRTFGWVQNPNKLETLRYVTEIFCHDSGANRDMRAERLPLLLRNGLISKDNYDDFKKLLENESIEIAYTKLKGRGSAKRADKCKISALGQTLAAAAPGSPEEKDAFTRALFAYPPVTRILEIPASGEPYTKFELGERLGFVGEKGFNGIPQDYFVALYCSEPSPGSFAMMK